MKLLIAIPALNEEESITAIIERSLAARDAILAQSPVTQVAITVVSDGSTDRTIERARAFGDRIHLIVFERNRGYGAAIMAAWEQSDADLLGFIDADGTCDPLFFGPLCRAAGAEGADVALGCRMNKDSHMPLVRRVGNLIFATLLSVFGHARVRDSASGMRVVRRAALPRLMPLPTGLHFTPAMSARAILADDLKIVEIDMPYHERAGRSKLNPVRDGLRFLGVILSVAFLYRPSRPLGILGVLCFALAGAVGLRFAWQFARFHELEPWMIYHFVVAQLAVTAGLLLLAAGYLGRKAVGITLSAQPHRYLRRGLLGAALSSRWFWWLPVLLMVAGAAAVLPAAVDYLRTGRVDPQVHHWSRFFALSFAWSLAFILAATRLVDITLDLLADRVIFLRGKAEAEARAVSAKADPFLTLVGSAHGRVVHQRRVRALARAIAPLLPQRGRLIDIGCGDGTLAALVSRDRPALTVEGYDVLVRDGTPIPVHGFDGRKLPLADRSVDAVMIVDVLHHCDDPMILLREAARICSGRLIIKDHRLSRPLARATLAFMDWVGNRPHGVVLPYHYWPQALWREAWRELGLTIEHYQTRLDLYPGPARWIFESGLHFVAALKHAEGP